MPVLSRTFVDHASSRPVPPAASPGGLPKTLGGGRSEEGESLAQSRPQPIDIPTPQRLRYGLKPGEAEALGLGPAMLRQVDLVNAANSEITAVERQRIIAHFGRRKGDTGSVEVQVALLSARIKWVAKHMKDHHKDEHSKRGLMGLVNQRRKLLKYMKRTGAEERYLELQQSFTGSL
eukprot:TRINITY_DN26129_c0_g1_i2.p1 TRINITY_DN26129_c0_g1~~TRINITY_DN26129_c0_g1_i2.p1  ORF type:complete len:177 (-),score=31.80 TRINITY_DN26129_c0_g1_i2:411-941(-)